MKELTLLAYHIVMGLTIVYILVELLFPFRYLYLEKTTKNIWLFVIVFVIISEITKCVPLYKYITILVSRLRKNG